MADDFDSFWLAYPRRVAKGDARKAWAQTARMRPPMDVLLKAIEAQKKSPQWLRDGGQYVPYPASWLRAERWDDEVEVDMGANVNGKEWFHTWPGIQAKAKELGIVESQYEYPHQFKAAVMRAAMKVA